MASSGERRLLFDTRGKRKHVIRVVYAILALLMGASLFLVVGPVNIGSLIGNSSEAGNASEVFDEQAERIERRLVQAPNDEQLLLALTRAKISAGNAGVEVVSETEAPTVTAAAREDFAQAQAAWSRYLKQTDEPNPTAAQLVAGTSFRLAEASFALPEIEEHLADAAAAQQIAAQQRPNVNSLSTLAIYEYYNGNFAAGDKAAKQAAKRVPAKAEAKRVKKQLAVYRKRGEQFEQQKKKVVKAESGSGKEALENPLGGLGGAGALGE